MILDNFDLAILARYQHDTLKPAKTLGEAIGLSPAAVQRRLKRLREGGVISAEIAVVSPDAVGLPVTCIVNVDLDRERSSDLDRFGRKMATCAEVQQCYYVTGVADFVLVVVTADMRRYETFTREHLLDDPNVKSFTTMVVLDRMKVGLAVPL
ncbi:MAG: Lrp/AsnC family transcriptional regulator [Luteimonas sp.]|nr:Lrp/AsnC family transcriptional regulator [Luteimonas sp.]